jgi:hypothetical protein
MAQGGSLMGPAPLKPAVPVRAPLTLLLVAQESFSQLEPQLSACMALLESRAAGDELLLIDNTGTGELARAASERFPPSETFEGARAELRTLARPKVIDACAAQLAGAQAASYERLLLLESGTTLELTALQALIAALEGSSAETRADAASVRECNRARFSARWQESELVLTPADPWSPGLSELCLLVRREAFLAVGGFDSQFGRGGLAGLDLERRMQHANLRVVTPERTRAHTGRIPRADEALWRERERYLLTWKELAGEALWQQHIRLLEERVLDLARRDARVELLGLSMALQEAPRLLAARA